MESRSNEVVSHERKINYQPSAVIKIIILSRYETMFRYFIRIRFIEKISLIFSYVS